MRRALGLEGGGFKPRAPERAPEPVQRGPERFSPGHKRRFVQDGEVPVTVVSGRGHGEPAPLRGSPSAGPNRLEAAEAALAAEIATRQQVERALAEAQATVHDLRTKLGHAEIARTEAVDHWHREQETIASLRAELRDCQEHLREAEAARSAAERSRRAPRVVAAASLEDLPEADMELAESAPVLKPAHKTAGRRGKRAAKPEAKSKLVRWWLKDDAAD